MYILFWVHRETSLLAQSQALWYTVEEDFEILLRIFKKVKNPILESLRGNLGFTLKAFLPGTCTILQAWVRYFPFSLQLKEATIGLLCETENDEAFPNEEGMESAKEPEGQRSRKWIDPF